MGGLLFKLQNFKKVKLIFGHPVPSVDKDCTPNQEVTYLVRCFEMINIFIKKKKKKKKKKKAYCKLSEKLKNDI